MLRRGPWEACYQRHLCMSVRSAAFSQFALLPMLISIGTNNFNLTVSYTPQPIHCCEVVSTSSMAIQSTNHRSTAAKWTTFGSVASRWTDSSLTCSTSTANMYLFSVPSPIPEWIYSILPKYCLQVYSESPPKLFLKCICIFSLS